METGVSPLKIGDIVRIEKDWSVGRIDQTRHRRRVGYVFCRGNDDSWAICFGDHSTNGYLYPRSEIVHLQKGDLVQVVHASGGWNTLAYDGVIDNGTIRPTLQLADPNGSGAMWPLHFKQWWTSLRLVEPGDLKPHPAARRQSAKKEIQESAKAAPVVIMDPPYGGAVTPQVDSHGRTLYAVNEIAMMLFVTEPLVLAFAQRVSEGALPLSEKWVETIKKMWRRNERGWRTIVEDRAMQMDGLRSELMNTPWEK